MKKSQSSDYMTRLEKTLAIGEEGNITAGKNLEIDGTTKLNGGIEAIHNYKILNGPYSLIVLFEKYDSINDSYCSFGFLKEEGDSILPGVFDYSISNDEITYFHGVFESYIYDFNGSNITVAEISTKP